MIYSEPYLFVLIISSFLLIPVSVAVRTLLAMKPHLVLPILRLHITNDLRETIIMETVGNSRASIQAGRQSW